MAVPMKIVYPVPPPTTNSLTAQQRMQLMRSTKKLGRILGTTPHLVDTSNSSALGPMHIQLPFDSVERYTYPRASMDSISSSSSSGSLSNSLISVEHPASSTQSLRSTSTRARSVRSKKSTASSDSSDSWPSRKPPMLRLAMTSSLETIPASPLVAATPAIYTRPRASFIDVGEDTHFTISPSSSSSPETSPTSPTFTIPSATTERRHKMDRLRRKLGEDVPLDLVFPSGDEPSPVSSGEERPLPALPIPRAPKPAGRISSTRDSIASVSPHRAPRKINVPKPSRPAPPPPTPAEVRRRRETKEEEVRIYHPYSGMAQRNMKERLYSIIESPDEHGSGCSEEFGLSRTGTPSSVESEWYGSDDESAVRTWSTRRGYEGWSGHLFNSLEPKRRSDNVRMSFDF
ncbi:hypothetical protein BDZ94DRAFT_1252722 [Collybia nuda]|uniref:Uncharacterized protein n=1 Tax=Collybia nuda TaxID=64659 RepID=A0A9P5Y9R5_9AGAR|nr:hypothetical protein BDZ94DRAFT_1252722 [Collybia nuda]